MRKESHLVLLKLFGEIMVSFALLCSHAEAKDAIASKEIDNDKLLDQYIKSKGQGIIVFDSSNIKQFWIEKCVVSEKDSFKVFLSRKENNNLFESDPLKIQLANVTENLDCSVEIITDSNDSSFSVSSPSGKILSASQTNDSFIQHHILASVFHLENTKNMSFSLIFSSNDSVVTIRKIILSFSPNKKSSYLSSPGTVNILEKDNIASGYYPFVINEDGSVSLSGKNFSLISSKKILVKNNTITNSATIKNTGKIPVMIYLGYAPYTKDQVRIDNRNTLYKKSNKVLKIISAEEKRNIILVDSMPEWEKGCFVVLNAKEDLSDFPNSSFLDGQVSTVNRINDNQVEIEMDKPISKTIEKGTMIRIQSSWSSTYLYTGSIRLEPGEETTLTSSISKDDDSLDYSPKAFCRGVHYVLPLIVSTPIVPNEETSILVKEFKISF